jgi:hypothetical protein
VPTSDKTALQEPAVTNLLDAFDVAFCMREFGVSEERLVDLVREHGNSVARIREAIGKVIALGLSGWLGVIAAV